MDNEVKFALALLSLVAVSALVGLFVNESKSNLTGFVVCGGFTSGDCPQNYQCRQTGMGCGSRAFGRCVRVFPTYTCLPTGQVQTAPQPATVRTEPISPPQIVNKKCGVNSFRVLGSCSIGRWRSSAGHQGAEWACYDGKRAGIGGRGCQVASYWQNEANADCSGRCS